MYENCCDINMFWSRGQSLRASSAATQHLTTQTRQRWRALPMMMSSMSGTDQRISKRFRARGVHTRRQARATKKCWRVARVGICIRPNVNDAQGKCSIIETIPSYHNKVSLIKVYSCIINTFVHTNEGTFVPSYLRYIRRYFSGIIRRYKNTFVLWGYQSMQGTFVITFINNNDDRVIDDDERRFLSISNGYLLSDPKFVIRKP